VAADKPRPRFDPDCPFCPGNEHLLPGIIQQTASGTPPGWGTRVVSNKFPALQSEPGMPPSGECGLARPGYGFHEVIIETARHDADLATLSEEEVVGVMHTCRDRYEMLATKPGIAAVLVFRNHGEHAGASLSHPHSQAIAIGMAPPRLAQATAYARTYHAEHGSCPTCDEIDCELDNGRRVVEATERFVVLVPFAAGTPFELRLLPRRHHASLSQCDDQTLIELAHLLRRTLQRLKAALGDPPYNYVIECGAVADRGAPYAHWQLRLMPNLGTPGGFELSAGLPINPSLPEDDARLLRATAAGVPAEISFHAPGGMAP
jgi:UDPglucose--hexose-1-phosphate uridylyltransferase